ncbi:YbaN family protein [Pseudomonas kuykendallii]|uniref:YbaN family protein n=1 Tax=Pseudomonas kuykendallii TaxID=1007099 RepID=UPI00289EBCB2|nr:YbaN family protein [Pseudomonas kuykendallii]
MPEAALVVPGRLRWLWLALAHASLGLALLGVFLPGLPTTEFVLLAAWAASRSSPRLSRWLENHRLLGPTLRDWRNGGVIARRRKWLASLSMALAFAVLTTTLRHWPSLLCIGLGMLCGVIWIWSRPERRA